MTKTRFEKDRRESNPRPKKPRKRRPAKKTKTTHPNSDDDASSSSKSTHNSEVRDNRSKLPPEEISVATTVKPKRIIQAVKPKKEVDPEYNQIKAMVQTKLWRACKFITCHQDRIKVSTKINSFLVFEGDSSPEEDQKWIIEKARDCNKGVNATRAYSHGEIKKKMHNYWLYNNKTLPTLEDFKACLKRTIDYEDEAQKDIWKFWVDQILDAACANKFDWNPAVRYYQTISKANDGEGNTQFNMLMNPSTEAWAMVCIENYYENWKKQFEWKANNPNAKLNTGKKEAKGKKDETTDEVEVPFPTNKWTDSCGGQIHYCGWHINGLKAYNTYKAMNKTARNTAKSEELEQQILEDLKLENGIIGDKPKDKKRAAVEEEVQIVDTLDF